jgi:hypothetical protein
MKQIAAEATSVSGASACRPAPVAEQWEEMPYWEKLRAIPPGQKIFPQAYAPLDPKNPKRRAPSAATHSNENMAPVYNITIKVSGDVNAPVNLLNAPPQQSAASARRPPSAAEQWEEMPYWEKLRAIPARQKIFPNAYAPLDPNNPQRRADSGSNEL